jgi:hypothetical protein
MTDGFGHVPCCDSASSRRSSKTGARRVRSLSVYLILLGTLLISGCTGLNSTTSTSAQQNPNTPLTAAAASMSPTSIRFGQVAVGSTVSQSVAISNTGSSNLSITQASVAAQGFSVSGISLPMTIGAGKQSTFNVVFSPKALGNISGAISVMSNAPDSPDTVSISGSGVAATFLLDASLANLNFGNVTIDSSSVLSVTLANAGNSNFSISNVSVSDARFTTSGVSAGLILAPGQNAILNVTFTPEVAGKLIGSVTVTRNAATTPTIISLEGSGVHKGSHSVTLAWTAEAPPVPVIGYNVYRSTVSGGPFTKLNSPAITAAAYMDPGVHPRNTYYYVVTSMTSTGMESERSNEVSATVPTP